MENLWLYAEWHKVKLIGLGFVGFLGDDISPNHLVLIT